MTIAKYKTIRGAQAYAHELASIFSKRQFVVQVHPTIPGAYTVRVMNDGQPVCYAHPRKPQRMRNLKAINGALAPVLED